ncbi:MAG: DUF3795 domain-containing protein [Peptococcaceae bacterium]|jgi:hypothetical protein|nr:DUF3795 domain-containing protein [Peptococcaceae bacterium]
MAIKYPKMGICGLSCQLCPMYHTDANSRCEGCKSKSRMTLGCPFITCAIKKKEVEFCWECKESPNCEKWRKHREAGAEYKKANANLYLSYVIVVLPVHA